MELLAHPLGRIDPNPLHKLVESEKSGTQGFDKIRQERNCYDPPMASPFLFQNDSLNRPGNPGAVQAMGCALMEC